MACSLSTLRYGAGAAGAFSIGLSAFPHVFERYAGLFRMLLNGSWGFLMGSHLWACLVQSRISARTLGAPDHEKLQRTTLSVFTSLSSFGGAILLLSTSALVPTNYLLRGGAAATVIASMLNATVVIPRQISMKQELADTEAGSPAKSPESETTTIDISQSRRRLAMLNLTSSALLWVSLSGLIPYVAS